MEYPAGFLLPYTGQLGHEHVFICAPSWREGGGPYLRGTRLVNWLPI